MSSDFIEISGLHNEVTDLMVITEKIRKKYLEKQQLASNGTDKKLAKKIGEFADSLQANLLVFDDFIINVENSVDDFEIESVLHNG